MQKIDLVESAKEHVEEAFENALHGRCKTEGLAHLQIALEALEDLLAAIQNES